MGLDNAINLRVRHKIDFNSLKDEGLMPYFLDFELNEWSSNDEWTIYEICYWRKWWGLRDNIIGQLNLPRDGGEHELSLTNLYTIRSIIEEWLEGKRGYDIATIWSFEELVGNMAWDIVKLSWLIEFIEDHAGKCVVTFVDSY